MRTQNRNEGIRASSGTQAKVSSPFCFILAKEAILLEYSLMMISAAQRPDCACHITQESVSHPSLCISEDAKKQTPTLYLNSVGALRFKIEAFSP
ncbi:hypothetical protein AtDm6_1143 [Acetobacter tropicalis]|uniref:Uncharacterized protein n=1 Tax=Acetobacter tropicalis TaxID=104102 RepID=A0A094YQS8_9PROT|nr:hypothetical protein AtDm6_1143 [Acetobacter tropicalis]